MNIQSDGSKNTCLDVWTYCSGVMEKRDRNSKEDEDNETKFAENHRFDDCAIQRQPGS